MIALGFVAAAVIGTTARWQLGRLPQPVGTLLANLAGAFALGLLAGAGNDSRVVLGIAGIGAFTTFSTVMVELLDLWTINRREATIYLVATLVGGVGLAWLGLVLA
jgi:fluoride exporter